MKMYMLNNMHDMKLFKNVINRPVVRGPHMSSPDLLEATI